MKHFSENKIAVALMLLALTACAPTYVVHGPQGGIATSWTWPKGFNQQTDTCRMVILMHGIFSSKDLPPMPALAKSLAEQGIASVAIDFGGHGKSEGTKQQMTIERELREARALFDYVDSLPYVSTISLLGHSQGGVIASMLAGRLAAENKAPEALVLLAPGSVIKEACKGGHFFRNTFDPKDPPEYIKCFGWYKVGREYMLTTQQLDIYGTSEQYQGPVCIIHGTKDGIVPLWCSERYDSIYRHSSLHLIEGENHLMVNHLDETKAIISDFLKSRPVVIIETSMGEIVVELFNETPLHRDNFLRLVDEHVYDSLLFHRVISGFMIQAGDTESKHAAPGVLLGDSDLPYQVPAEIRVDQGIVHLRGVLAAAREGDDTNPERASSSTQFYITQVDVPRLDGKYTIFGRVLRGMDVVDAIAGVATDRNDRPLEDIRILSTFY